MLHAVSYKWCAPQWPPQNLDKILSETTHAIPQLSDVNSHFDVYSPSVAEYENEQVPKIHITAEEPPWDQAISEYSEWLKC